MTLALLGTAVTFFILGRYLPYWLGHLVHTIRTERILSKLLPREVDECRLCSEPHQWISVTSDIDENGEFKFTNICKNCGFIPKLNLMATKEGLEQIENNKKLREQDEKIRDEFIKKEEEEIRNYFTEELKNGMDFQKLTQLYLAGSTVKERMVKFIIHKTQKGTEANSEQR